MSYAIGPGHFMTVFSREESIQELFSVQSDVLAMIAFERALALALGRFELISSKSATRIVGVLDDFRPDMEDLRTGFKRDGVASPNLVNQIRNQLNDEDKSNFHYGTTSQDLTDTSLMMRMRDGVASMSQNIKLLNLKLEGLATSYSGERVLMARTRMQNALPISVPEKLGNWCAQLEGLISTMPQKFLLQLGGGEGAARKFGASYDDITSDMASTLDLTAAKHVWHTDRQSVTNICFWFSQVSTVMGKIAQDVLFMAQTDIGEARIEGGGFSSAMPHKKNPVLAEIILAQTHYCHTQMSGLNRASIHENERSGAAWTLEWLLVPAILVTSADIVMNTQEMIEKLIFNTK